MNASTFAHSFVNFFVQPERDGAPSEFTNPPETVVKQPAPDKPAVRVPRAKPLIMVACKIALARERIRSQFTEAGMEVLEFASGSECLRNAPECKPDVILVNLNETLDEDITASTFREIAKDSGNPPVIFLGGAHDAESLGRVLTYIARKQERERVEMEVASVIPINASTASPVETVRDLAPVLRLAEWVFKPIAAHKQIALKLDAPAAGLLAKCDEVHVQRVIENLLSNAIKFSPARTTITLGAQERNGWLSFWVDDEGPGVPLADQSKLFEADGESLEFLGDGEIGCDRGLLVCKHIADKQQGRISMCNRDEGGARFELRLPAAHAPRVSALDALADKCESEKLAAFALTENEPIKQASEETPAVA